VLRTPRNDEFHFSLRRHRVARTPSRIISGRIRLRDRGDLA
jgi:hypothetical protein